MYKNNTAKGTVKLNKEQMLLAYLHNSVKKSIFIPCQILSTQPQSTEHLIHLQIKVTIILTTRPCGHISKESKTATERPLALAEIQLCGGGRQSCKFLCSIWRI